MAEQYLLSHQIQGCQDYDKMLLIFMATGDKRLDLFAIQIVRTYHGVVPVFRLSKW